VRPAAVPMAPVAIKAAPPPPPSKVPAYVAFGGGGVGLLVGAVSGGLALETASDVRAVCGPGPNCPHPGERSAASAAKTEAWVSNAGFFVAIAGAVTGTVLLMVKVSPAQKSAVGSAFGPGGLTLRF
jgi:hypothetical protein